MPITNTNQPKAGFSFVPSIFFEMLVPSTMPISAKIAIRTMKCQSVAVWKLAPQKPINDFTAIIISEVPTASFIGSLDKITNAGIIINPPPAPTNPVSVPSMAPCIKMSR